MKVKKMYIFLFIMFFTLFISNSSVFANVDIYGKSYPDLPKNMEDYNHVIIVYSPHIDRYRLFFSNATITWYKDPYDIDPNVYLYARNGATSIWQWYPATSNSWELVGDYPTGVDVSKGVWEYFTNDTEQQYYTTFVYSKQDLYGEYRDNLTLFFQATPLTVSLSTQEIIMGSLSQIVKQITENMTIIIPVGLVVLGIGLIIYLVRLVILRLQ